MKGKTGYLTTANHCDETGKLKITTGKGVVIADKSYTDMPSIDTKLIDPKASPATGPYLYTGTSWNSSKKSRIVSVGVNNKGDKVCIAGASSGSRCGTVVNDKWKVSGLDGDWYILVKSNSGWLSAGGDSGGAWYKELKNNTVEARGMHIQGSKDMKCPAAVDPAARSYGCSSYSIYVPATVIQNSLHVRVER